MASPRKCKIECGGMQIETLVTGKTTEIDEWIRDIYTLRNGNGAVVGLCTQCKPAAKDKNSKIATLQLCMDNKCLIIQLFHLDQIPECLKSFLLDPCFCFVGMGIGCDVFRKLADEYGLVCCRFENLHDLGMRTCPSEYKNNHKPTLTWLAWYSGLKSMQRIPMEIFMSNWEAPSLNLDQVKYGCTYAYAFQKIGLATLQKSWTSDCDSKGC